jgi:catechol 2,3-dioxygenase-like lactoylglutathione lyase family enzyme
MAALDLLVLYCGDPAACRDFYAGLGLTFTNERHLVRDPEGRAVEITAE